MATAVVEVVGAAAGAGAAAGLVSALSLPPQAAKVKPTIEVNKASFSEVFMVCPLNVVLKNRRSQNRVRSGVIKTR